MTSGIDVRRVRFDYRKACRGLYMCGERVLTASRVGILYSFGESVLTSAKRVGGFQMNGKSVLTSTKHVGSL